MFKNFVLQSSNISFCNMKFPYICNTKIVQYICLFKAFIHFSVIQPYTTINHIQPLSLHNLFGFLFNDFKNVSHVSSFSGTNHAHFQQIPITHDIMISLLHLEKKKLISSFIAYYLFRESLVKQKKENNRLIKLVHPFSRLPTLFGNINSIKAMLRYSWTIE